MIKCGLFTFTHMLLYLSFKQYLMYPNHSDVYSWLIVVYFSLAGNDFMASARDHSGDHLYNHPVELAQVFV